ncbi:hypothetical protein ACFWN1_08740 [Streptomyces sp. NPDC058459]|uniref:hypothetical protein n=1 Tax=Streptomyces sp. NPDC058459 TaxID=3346508 RepID=UPI003668E11C
MRQYVQGGGSTTRQILFQGILDGPIRVVRWFALAAVAARLRALLARPQFRLRGKPTTGWMILATGNEVAATRPTDGATGSTSAPCAAVSVA